MRKLLNEKHMPVVHSHSVPLYLVNKEEMDEGVLYVFETGLDNYTTTIFVKDPKYNFDTKCLVRCTCPSFIFQYQTRLFRNKSLYGPDPEVNKLPERVKKPDLTGCKHLAVCAHYMLIRRYNPKVLRK